MSQYPSSSSSSPGAFALQTSLQAAIKSCGATCGAVLSFWDPESATLSSVEMLENSAQQQTATTTTNVNHMMNNSTSTRATNPQHHHDDNNTKSSSPKDSSNGLFSTTKKQQQEEPNVLDENEKTATVDNISFSSPFAMDVLSHLKQGFPQDQNQQNAHHLLDSNLLSIPTGDEEQKMEDEKLLELSATLKSPQDEDIDGINSMNSRSATKAKVESGQNNKNNTNNKTAAFQAVSAARATAIASRSTAQFAFSHRCVAVNSSMSSSLSSSAVTTKVGINHSNNNFSKKNGQTLAEILADDDKNQTTLKFLRRSENDDDNNNNNNNNNSHEPVSSSHQNHHHHQYQQRQVFQSAHNILLNKALAPSVIQTVAKSGIAVHSTASSSPYLVIPILAKKTVVAEVYGSASRRLLEQGGPGGSLSHMVVVGVLVLVGSPLVDEVAEDKALAVLEGRNATSSAKSKNNHDDAQQYSEDGTVKIKTNMSLEQAINTYSGKRVSFRAEEETLAVSLARTVFSEILTTKEGIVVSEKNLNVYFSGLLKNTGDGNNTNSRTASSSKKRATSSSPSKPSNASFRKVAGNIRLATRLGGGNKKKGATNNNNSTENDYDDNHHHGTENKTSSNNINDITLQDDFHRSTTQRRIPQVIRIPDSTIFLSQRSILKDNKADEFQALPDLPEVRKTIEEAEQALSSLREQNITLNNAINNNTKSDFVNVVGSSSSSYTNRNQKQQNYDSVMVTDHHQQQDDDNNDVSKKHFAQSLNHHGNKHHEEQHQSVTIQQGMEKLEKRISALRSENISLRSHIEMLNHRLDSVLSKKSIQTVAQQQIMSSLSGRLGDLISSSSDDHHHQSRSTTNTNTMIMNEIDEIFNSKRKFDLEDDVSTHDHRRQQQNNSPRVSSATSSTMMRSSYPRSGNSNTANYIVPRPPSSSSRNEKHLQHLIMKRPSDILSRPLPASVMLETKAVDGLDKLKREVASRRGARKANG